MRILPFYVVPIFLRRTLPGELGSQIRFFDVFYKEAPVVGWHVMDSGEEGCPITGFFAEAPTEGPSGVSGFTASEAEVVQKNIAGFTAACEENDGSGITGFAVSGAEDSQEEVAGFTVEFEDDVVSDYVAGFTVEEK